MAIKILSKGLPLAGYLKLGESGGEQNGRQRPPVKFDHWEVTGTERDVNGALLPDAALLERLVSSGHVRTCGGCERSQRLAQQLGIGVFAERGLPREIPILLPYDDLALSLQHSLSWFRGSAQFCRGDGEQAERRTITRNARNEETFGPFQTHAPCASGGCPEFAEDAAGNRKCKPLGRLRVMIGVQQRVGQAYEFRTTSWNSLRNLQESLEQIQLVSGGVLQYVPLFLECAPQRISRPGGRTTTHMIAKISFRGTPNELLSTVHESLRLRAPLIENVRRLEASITRRWEPDEAEVRALRREFDHEALEGERTAAAPEPAEPPVHTGAERTEPRAFALDVDLCKHEKQDLGGDDVWVCVDCGLINPPAPEPPEGDPFGAPAPAQPEPPATNGAQAPQQDGPIGNEQLQQLWSAVDARATAILGKKADKATRKRVLDAVLAKSGAKSTGDIPCSRFAEVLALAEVVEL